MQDRKVYEGINNRPYGLRFTLDGICLIHKEHALDLLFILFPVPEMIGHKSLVI